MMKNDHVLQTLDYKSLNPIQDGLFRGCSRMGGVKRPPSLKSDTRILQ